MFASKLFSNLIYLRFIRPLDEVIDLIMYFKFKPNIFFFDKQSKYVCKQIIVKFRLGLFVLWMK